MRTLVVYETMFGTTGVVARAIADGLAPLGEVEVVEAAAAMRRTLPRDVRLLVIGGPAYPFGMSRPLTRRRRARWARVDTAVPRLGIREWIASHGPELFAVAVATFDTKPVYSQSSWSAARDAAKLLRAHGADLVLPPETFRATGITGRLADGELARAHEWGEALAKDVPAFAF
jgi:hypothetical protein